MNTLSPSGFRPLVARRRRSYTRLAFIVFLHALLLAAAVRFSASHDLLPTQILHEAIHIHEVALIPPPDKPQPKRVVKAESIPQPLLNPPPVAAEAIEIKVADTPPTPITAPVVASADETPRPAPAAAIPSRVDAALICPEQSVPEMPRKALIEGIQGVVRAEAKVQGGAVREVRFLGGPTVFYEAVRSAMFKYHCSPQANAVIAVQEFNFRIN